MTPSNPGAQGLRQKELCEHFGMDYCAVAKTARQLGISTHDYLRQVTGWQLWAERYYPRG